MSEIKKFLYVNRKAPYGTVYALESLEVVLIGAPSTRTSVWHSSTTASSSLPRGRKPPTSA
jgi:sulfur relay (sulfurtransferase) DsrF/TusC family protein